LGSLSHQKLVRQIVQINGEPTIPVSSIRFVVASDQKWAEGIVQFVQGAKENAACIHRLMGVDYWYPLIAYSLAEAAPAFESCAALYRHWQEVL
jgi:uncharacterized alpha-E superfamily protein